jgi:hypothetical protein
MALGQARGGLSPPEAAERLKYCSQEQEMFVCLKHVTGRPHRSMLQDQSGLGLGL